jgi:hypothetical protein
VKTHPARPWRLSAAKVYRFGANRGENDYFALRVVEENLGFLAVAELLKMDAG